MRPVSLYAAVRDRQFRTVCSKNSRVLSIEIRLIAVCFAGTAKAEKVLGWKAEKGIEDMCRDAWNWQKSQD